MFSQLKLLVIHHRFPVIYLTLNPGERYSPLSLLYAGEEIDIMSFDPLCYEIGHRIQIMLQNPLAVVEYFHNTVKTVLMAFLKRSLFDDQSDVERDRDL